VHLCYNLPLLAECLMSDQLLVLHKTARYLYVINLFVGNMSDLVLQA